METKRIVTNIVEWSKLKKTPCSEWSDRFENGKIDAHKAFKLYGQKYIWLYKYSNYDLIEWEVANNLFDWKENSWVIPILKPNLFDPDKYNWKDCSGVVAEYLPEKFDAERFNWEKDSYYVARFLPEKLDPEKFNWEEDSDAVAQYCKEKINPDKFNWERFYLAIIAFCPEKLALMPEKYKYLIK